VHKSQLGIIQNPFIAFCDIYLVMLRDLRIGKKLHRAKAQESF